MSDAPTRTPEVFLSHANARTNEYGRQLAVERYLSGHKVKDIAAQLGISRTTVYKWIRRFEAEGAAGLRDRRAAAPVQLRPDRSARRVARQRPPLPVRTIHGAAQPTRPDRPGAQDTQPEHDPRQGDRRYGIVALTRTAPRDELHHS